MVTTLKNLSLYWQIGGRRRYLKEVPEKNRIENYESSNDATSSRTTASAAWSRTSKSRSR